MSKTQNNPNANAWIVKRDHHKVSDKVYNTKDEAFEEFDHWNRIVNRSNDGTTVTIAPYETRD